jgi:hypothetical protein
LGRPSIPTARRCGVEYRDGAQADTAVD